VVGRCGVVGLVWCSCLSILLPACPNTLPTAQNKMSRPDGGGGVGWGWQAVQKVGCPLH